jgi:hypothetical protein
VDSSNPERRAPLEDPRPASKDDGARPPVGGRVGREAPSAPRARRASHLAEISVIVMADRTPSGRARAEHPRPAPCLATVLIGDDPASVTYVRMKQNRRRDTGIESRHVALPAVTTTAEAVAAVEQLSADGTVDGILCSTPSRHRSTNGDLRGHRAGEGCRRRHLQILRVDGSRPPRLRVLHARRDHATARPLRRGARRVARCGHRPITVLGKPAAMLAPGPQRHRAHLPLPTRDLAAHVASADVVVAAVGIRTSSEATGSSRDAASSMPATTPATSAMFGRPEQRRPDLAADRRSC